MRPATEADLPRAAALSARIGWNQVTADWRHFLRDGAVQVIDDDDPHCLAATAAVLRFGPGLAWISMVLVRPDRRRAGLAMTLMRWATERLQGVAGIALDATPAGREVYRQLGFRDVLGFTRWAVPDALPAPDSIAPRAVTGDDWPAILALDATAFGAPRATLLRGFAARAPAGAFIAPGGFVLARDGLRTPQIGPVVAQDAPTAMALIAAARRGLGRPAVLDLADAATPVAAWLGAHGATPQRPFTRMVLGALPPTKPGQNFAFAGPEFG
ncbi:MAG: GNAT family N-acetyltransferase [Alphaproteobacteria bacterium]|nr:GNAT family N-acetyltransferase [Alphaproteobacteria bacterium]